MHAYRRNNESVASAAAEYDDGADTGKYPPIYQFGEGVLEGEDITVSEKEIRIPGFGKSVNLDLENPFEDMVKPEG
jgi:acetoacetyl-[acyl-carrier protein] synthase